MAIGGFFELELPGAGEPYHSRALALSSGRACLRRILECLKPARVWVPFYVCDAVLPAIVHAGADVEFYPIDEALDPILPSGQPSDRDVVMYVNYFGIKSATASRLASSLGIRAVIDDTQAFFQRGYSGSSSFNSARKFFGVPDGGYAYAEGLHADVSADPPTNVRYDHLVVGVLGDRERAFQLYRESEACVNDEPQAMSALSRRVLAGIDYERTRCAREQNFARLHARLGSKNRLRFASEDAVAPFCYPLLIGAPVPWDALWQRELFAPRLWPDVEARAPQSTFPWERELAARLIPLPVDQRYGAADMDHVVETLAEVLAW
jgi:hypothetical protein